MISSIHFLAVLFLMFKLFSNTLRFAPRAPQISSFSSSLFDKANNHIMPPASLNPLLTSNPLLDFPPFNKIKDEHFPPAFEVAMQQQTEEINKIIETDFKSVVDLMAALEKSGRRLSWVYEIFYNLNSCLITPERQKLESEILPKVSAHKDSLILMNPKLFAKVKVFYDEMMKNNNKNNNDSESDSFSNVDSETKTLLTRYYKNFVRAGAELETEEERSLLRKLNSELSALETKFQQSVLAEVSASSVWFNDAEKELPGISKEELDEFQKHAEQQTDGTKKQGHYLVKLRNSTCQPHLLQNLHNRESRKKIFNASISRGIRGNEHDNRKTVIDVMMKRSQKAKLLGFKNYANFNLSKEMAGSTDTVDDFLKKLSEPAKKNLEHEAKVLTAFAKQRDGDIVDKLEPYDWDYYRHQFQLTAAQKETEKETTSNDEENNKTQTKTNNINEHFELDNVLQNGLFYAASRLYNMSFREETDDTKFPKYHPTLRIFSAYHRTNDEKTAEDRYLGTVIFDFFERPATKYQGACIYHYRDQSNRKDIGAHRPIIGFYTNFKIAASQINENNNNNNKPLCFLSYNDRIALFHEFGHTLQGLHSQVQYPTLSCTINLANDYVEFPSKVNEHFAHVPEILSNYAKHYKTGEPLPKAVFDKLTVPRNHQVRRENEENNKNESGGSNLLKTSSNMAYETLEFLASVALDQAWHRLEVSPSNTDSDENNNKELSEKLFSTFTDFEKSALETFNVYHPVCPPRYLSCFFSHIVCWAYPATYYGYLFSEVLDADATEWFYENGETNNPENGKRMKRIILSTGATKDPKELLREFFGGREPRVEPMLMRRGLL